MLHADGGNILFRAFPPLDFPAGVKSREFKIDNLYIFIFTCRIAFSDSPTHLLNISGPFTAIKFNPLSVANAFAISVLLQPGGPYIRMPFGGSMFMRVNTCRKDTTSLNFKSMNTKQETYKNTIHGHTYPMEGKVLNILRKNKIFNPKCI